MMNRISMQNETAKFRELAQLLQNYRDIDLAYLFGSSSKECAGPAPSDVDIAILLRKGADTKPRGDLRIEIALKASKVFGRRADIVMLRGASPFLKYQVLKHGRLLIEREGGMDRRFRFDAMTEYFDAVVLQNFFYSRLMGRKKHG